MPKFYDLIFMTFLSDSLIIIAISSKELSLRSTESMSHNQREQTKQLLCIFKLYQVWQMYQVVKIINLTDRGMWRNSL